MGAPNAAETRRDEQVRQRVLVGTVSNYAGQLAAFASLFLLTPFILHHLGPVAYGLWSLIGSVVAYASLLDAGIWGAIIKYVAEFKARESEEASRRLLATTMVLYLCFGSVAILGTALVAPHFAELFNLPPEQRLLATRLFLLMGIGVGLALPVMMPLAVLRGLQRYDLVNLVDIFGTIVTASATVLVLLRGGGVLGLVIANLGGMIVMQLPAIWAIRRVAPELRFGWRDVELGSVRTVLSYSWPLLVKDLAGRFQTRSDEIIIGAFLPVSAVTLYTLPRRLSEVTATLTRQFMKVLLPLASELDATQDRVRLRLLYTAGTRLTLALFLPTGMILAILARPILTLWVGPLYGEQAHLVVILIAASFALTSQWPAGAVLQGMARHRLLAATALGSGLANLLLSFLLVGPYGITGVALGTLIPTVIEGFCFVLPYATRVLGVSAREVAREIVGPALLPAIPMAAAVYGLSLVVEPHSLLDIGAVAAIGYVVYGTVYLVIGASPAERASYRALAQQALRLLGATMQRREEEG